MISVIHDETQFFLLPAVGLIRDEGIWITFAFLCWGLSIRLLRFP